MDLASRFKKEQRVFSVKEKPKITKATVHIAWLKDQTRGLCEADEVAFYLICGKWGLPTKRSGKSDWKGDLISSAIGLQAELHAKDVLFPFLDKLRLFAFEHQAGNMRESRFHIRWDGQGNLCYTIQPFVLFDDVSENYG
jgi:hypothetical protein